MISRVRILLALILSHYKNYHISNIVILECYNKYLRYKTILNPIK